MLNMCTAQSLVFQASYPWYRPKPPCTTSTQRTTYFYFYSNKFDAKTDTETNTNTALSAPPYSAPPSALIAATPPLPHSTSLPLVISLYTAAKS